MPEPAFSDPEDRAINLSEDEAVIVRSLFQSGAQSRADLARETRFSRTKVTELVGQLMAREILQEIHRNGQDQGKWKNLTINQGLGFLVGIDIGTTSVDVGLADCSCALLDRLSASTNVNDGTEVVLGEAVRLLENLLAQNGVREDQILGMGVGVPGPVSYPSGMVIGGQFMPGWEGLRFRNSSPPASRVW